LQPVSRMPCQRPTKRSRKVAISPIPFGGLQPARFSKRIGQPGYAASQSAQSPSGDCNKRSNVADGRGEPIVAISPIPFGGLQRVVPPLEAIDRRLAVAISPIPFGGLQRLLRRVFIPRTSTNASQSAQSPSGDCNRSGLSGPEWTGR